METLVVKVSEPKKTKFLIDFLKSIDYVKSVDYFDNLLTFKTKLDEVNRIAQASSLYEMSLSDINNEIDAYRSGK